ncbi:unnamed protein product [Prunus armeniaca]|uniref:SWIM-type domain-containing protein n=1 Tax=Prunus armeniaca TaxID=36596 RepID=A0A6J5UAH0_PRUAR|nr:unnamed protein product [Prunus armeniaca]
MADHVDNNKKPPLPFKTPMQHQMGRIYAREILEMFEREDFRSLLCLFELVEQDETQCRYKVSERVNPGVTRMKELVHDKDADKAYCSCKGFEFGRSKVCKVASDLIDLALLWDEGFELLEKSFEDIRGKLTSSSSSDTKLGGLVGENLQPTQSTQDSEPTMTESFMQEFDFITTLSMRNLELLEKSFVECGCPGCPLGLWDFQNLKPLFEGE